MHDSILGLVLLVKVAVLHVAGIMQSYSFAALNAAWEAVYHSLFLFSNWACPSSFSHFRIVEQHFILFVQALFLYAQRGFKVRCKLRHKAAFASPFGKFRQPYQI